MIEAQNWTCVCLPSHSRTDLQHNYLRRANLNPVCCACDAFDAAALISVRSCFVCLVDRLILFLIHFLLVCLIDCLILFLCVCLLCAVLRAKSRPVSRLQKFQMPCCLNVPSVLPTSLFINSCRNPCQKRRRSSASVNSAQIIKYIFSATRT